MSAAEIREAAAKLAMSKLEAMGLRGTGHIVGEAILGLPLPDEEGMVERAKLAMWEVCAAHSLEATNRGGARYAVTGNVVEELARAVLRVINGGKP